MSLIILKNTDSQAPNRFGNEIEGIQLVCDQIPPAPASTSASSDCDSDSDSDSDAPVVSIPFPSNLVNVNYGDGGTDILYSSATCEVSRASSSPA
jgi:hypothetical protein